MNKITALGRIYKNGSIGTSKNGKTYIGFSILDTRKEKEETVKFRCVAFNGTAEKINEWCENGDQVLVYGSLENDQKTNSFRFVVSDFQRAGQKQDKPETTQEPKENQFF